jgi:hypothetical protein
MPEAIWACRNCKLVFTYNFPALAQQFLALEKSAVASAASDPAS